MSEHDIRALEANFENWRKERVPNAAISDAFELYAIDQTLKNADLSDEEVQSGKIAGPDDGGVDGAYFFINGKLITTEATVPDPAMFAQLVLIQAKAETSFKEDAIEKLYSFSRDLFNWSVLPESLTYLNSDARDFIAAFRASYDSIIGSAHHLRITYIYASKSDSPPHPKVLQRIEVLKSFVKDNFSAALVDCFLWDCKALLNAARSSSQIQRSLDITKFFATDDGAFVCLATLKSLAEFLNDGKGDIKRSILEPNVRDYQGKRNPVNVDIRKTLTTGEDKEFWWLNNGITILAKNPQIGGNKLSMESPEVVNGLQTSREIFDYFKENPTKEDKRNVLIRILVPLDEQMRTRITKATNFQTAVEPLSLRATDQIHFDIEDRLKLYQLYYDRRKGKYRDLRKPLANIVSIRAMAQAVIACVLQRPNDARARPQSLLNDDEDYKTIFNHEYNRDVYVASIMIDSRVEEYLKSSPSMSRDHRRDLRYYVDVWATCMLSNKSQPTASDVAACVSGISTLSNDSLHLMGDQILSLYNKLGGSDKVAKGPELRKEVLAELSKLFPGGPGTDGA